MNSCVYINPDIPELQDYKNRFSQPFHAPKLISPSKSTASSAAIGTANRISIGELFLQDADESKDAIFTCRAKITKFVPVNGWYYFGCPKCRVKLQMGDDSALNICRQHGKQVGVPIYNELYFWMLPLVHYRYKLQIRLEDEEDSTPAMLIGKPAEKLFQIPCSELVDQGNTDPAVIPQTILDFENIYKIWHLGFGIRTDFVVKGVYTDTDPIDQEIEEEKTPEKLPDKRKSLSPEDSTLGQLLNVTRKTRRETGSNSKKKSKVD